MRAFVYEYYVHVSHHSVPESAVHIAGHSVTRIATHSGTVCVLLYAFSIIAYNLPLRLILLATGHPLFEL